MHANMLKYTHTHINWHTYSGDESSDSSSSLKAMEFRISLVLKGQPGKVNLLLIFSKVEEAGESFPPNPHLYLQITPTSTLDKTPVYSGF